MYDKGESMQLIFYGAIITAMIFIFIKLIKSTLKQSVIREAIDMMKEIIAEPEDLKKEDNNENNTE